MRYFICCLCIVWSLFGQSQSDAPQKHSLTIKKSHTVYPKSYVNQFDFELKHVEVPSPGGESLKSHIAKLKKDVIPNIYPRVRTGSIKKTNTLEANPPILGSSFYMARPYVPVLDSSYAVTGGTPLDNTLAISNGGFLMTSINSKIYAHDIVADTAMLNVGGSENTIGFSFFASQGNVSTDSPFDPKLLYDPNRDRFVMVFVSGRDETNSKLVLGFSSSNNPADPWHIYELPGN
ncbi:MAG: hypothetical protein MRY83_17050, partial [Flavobacteriales bacterium]|nr:hypothetical protein [Flavobacteriales bacterium]